jgi:hypothetical protein
LVTKVNICELPGIEFIHELYGLNNILRKEPRKAVAKNLNLESAIVSVKGRE